MPHKHNTNIEPPGARPGSRDPGPSTHRMKLARTTLYPLRPDPYTRRTATRFANRCPDNPHVIPLSHTDPRLRFG